MSYLDKNRKLNRYSNSSSFLDYQPSSKHHVKPYTNSSDIPVEAIGITGQTTANDFQSNSLVSLNKSRFVSPLINTECEEKVLEPNIDSRSFHEDKPQLNYPVGNTSNQKHSESRLIETLKRENSKLKLNLKSAENNIARLYSETKILSEQLTIYQDKIEMSSSIELYSSNFEGVKYEKAIKSATDKLNSIYQDLQSKLIIVEKKLEKATSRQIHFKNELIHRSQVGIESNMGKDSQKERETKNTSEALKKIEEFKDEIVRLGILICKMQEKREKDQKISEDKILQLNNENLKLREDLIERDTQAKTKDTTPLSPTITLQSMAFRSSIKSGHILGGKTEHTQREKDIKHKIEYLNISYNEQLERLSKELEDFRESYASLEIQFMRTQESLRLSEESKLNLEENLKQDIRNLKIEIGTLEDMIDSQSIEINTLSDNNNYLQAQLKDHEKLVSKYNRLVIDLQTSEEIISSIQKELKSTKSVIKEQTEIINSLKSGFYPHNARQDILNSPSSPRSPSGASSQSALFSSMTQELHSVLPESNEESLYDLRLQFSSLSLNHEKSLQDLRVYQELYQGAKNDCDQLENILEGLQYELQNLKAGE